MYKVINKASRIFYIEWNGAGLKKNTPKQNKHGVLDLNNPLEQDETVWNTMVKGTWEILKAVVVSAVSAKQEEASCQFNTDMFYGNMEIHTFSGAAR